MHIKIDERAKRLCIYLTQDEGADPALRAHLRPLLRAFAARGFCSALLFSGREDLKTLSGELLAHNLQTLLPREEGALP